MTVSNTVSPKEAVISAGTFDTLRATCAGVRGFTDSPSISTSPEVIGCILLMHRIMVVFPHPLGPISPTSFPAGRLNDTPLHRFVAVVVGLSEVADLQQRSLIRHTSSPS
jgi:hypothetical protein